jgi:endoglucanase Acf2
VKDVANWEGADDRFPRLRYFDPYAGHSWASGPAMFDEGNNEESSSEDVNFAAALVLWGAVRGDDAVRDLGAFLYETTVSAVEQYWLDVDDDVFPKAYAHPVAGIVWGDGVKYDTWWDRNPVFVHGINVLPLTGASLYLGRRPAVVHADWEHLLRENRGPVHQWRDVMWMYLALDDASAASKLLDEDHHFDPEFGNSWANTFHWIHALATLGHVDSEVLADTTTYAAFRNGNVRTYVAYNPARSAAKVTFTDGTALDVPPLSMRHATHPLK